AAGRAGRPGPVAAGGAAGRAGAGRVAAVPLRGRELRTGPGGRRHRGGPTGDDAAAGGGPAAGPRGGAATGPRPDGPGDGAGPPLDLARYPVMEGAPGAVKRTSGTGLAPRLAAMPT